MSWIGRAQLAQLLLDGEGTDADVAHLLGYRVVGADHVESVGAVQPDESGEIIRLDPPEPPQLLAQPQDRPPLWQLVESQPKAAPPLTREELELDARLPDETGSMVAARQSEPLTLWSALWPTLYDLIAQRFESRRIDVRRLVRQVGAGRPLTELPRMMRTCWPERLTIWKDRAEALVPLWDDQDIVHQHLARWCPVIEVKTHRCAFVPRVGQSTLLLGDWQTLPGSVRKARGDGLAMLSARPPRGSTRHWRVATWARPTARGGPERLLRLVAAAFWVRPALLRALRRLLPAAEADIGTELAVWSHADVNAGVDALVLRAAASRAYLSAIAGEDEALRVAVCKLIEGWHRTLPDSVRHTTALLWPGQHGPFDAQAAERYFNDAIGEVLTGASDLTWFAAKAGERLAAAARYRPTLTKPASILWIAGNSDSAADVPEGVDLSWASVVRPGAPRRLRVVQRGRHLRLEPAVGAASGVVLGELPTTQAVVWIDDGETQRQQLTDQPIEWTQTEWLRLETDQRALTLERRVWPDWAVAMGISRGRLWADVEIPSGRIRLFWDPTDDIPAWRADRRRVSADEFGIREDLSIANVPVRFRLIPAGTFMMGSPDDEAGRDDDEGPQHEVALTEPFWLAESPVTQALWQAVMGANPSRFKGADRPVETVSWEDATRFVLTVERSQPGLALRLPTEAQWEYACRAGDLGSRYGELDIVAWHHGNSDGGTHPVKQKRGNAWGLYDMLGNVFEWTTDLAYRLYQPAMVTDPTGPERGADRIFRGGSWSYSTMDVRAAYRSAYAPDLRYGWLGFRLSRGRAPSARGASSGRARRAGALKGIEEMSRSGAEDPRGGGGASIAERDPGGLGGAGIELAKRSALSRLGGLPRRDTSKNED